MGKLHLNAIHPPTKVGGFLAKGIVKNSFEQVPSIHLDNLLEKKSLERNFR